MKKTGKIVVSTYILISISMICGLKVNASAATISGNDFITAQLAEQQAVMNEETLSFSVDYPEILKCGEATTFTLTPTGVQIPLHRITDSASNGSVFPVVTEHFSASSDHAFL